MYFGGEFDMYVFFFVWISEASTLLQHIFSFLNFVMFFFEHLFYLFWTHFHQNLIATPLFFGGWVILFFFSGCRTTEHMSNCGLNRVFQVFFWEIRGSPTFVLTIQRDFGWNISLEKTAKKRAFSAQCCWFWEGQVFSRWIYSLARDNPFVG